jgi:adenosylcobinamide-GDP ribazoletransferase
LVTDLRVALAFLTILPVGQTETQQPGRSFAYFPLVGLLIGLLLAAVAAGLGPSLGADAAAFGVLVAWVVITGGLHLDGLGDACDGLLASVEPARRLEIMKDPRTGSWAVIGLVLVLLGKWVLLQDLPAVSLIAIPVTGRWVMVLVAYAFPYARSGGLGGYFRQGLGRWQALIASLTTIIVLAGLAAIIQALLLLALLLMPLIMGLVGMWASRRLGGGLTGDVYGALCELTELMSLFLLQVLWNVN